MKNRLQLSRKRLFLCFVATTWICPWSLQGHAGDAVDDSSVDPRTTNRELIRKSVEGQFASLFDGMSEDARAGYRHLVESVYLPHDFDEEVLDELDRMAHATPMQDVSVESASRESTWKAYGLTPRPDDPSKPLQYVVTESGKYVMNCFACHGGSVYGAVYPGAPNNLYALESLTEAVRGIKIQQGKPLAHMDVGSMFMPLGTSNGTSNAVMFGVALMNYRDADLNVHASRLPAAMVHHDMDAPGWWQFHRKSHIYIDGFAEKGHKGLMQFMLVRQNGPKQFRSWEKDFRKVYSFISELRPPKYPLPIDSEKAAEGRQIFNSHCASCHGEYGNRSETSHTEYAGAVVPIEDLGTDSVRLRSLTPRHRKAYGDSWFADYGKQDTRHEVDGYVAPPLDGVWASAPYLHNGSVPTLWHLLHPEERPVVWRRQALAMDEHRIGLLVEELADVPDNLDAASKRWYFDTRIMGKSAAGHDYPSVLSEPERESLLEYLKSL
jgi:mono/diheme cytochrome c family protein